MNNKLPLIYRGHTDSGFFAEGLALSADGNPTMLLPGNHPSRDSKYICIVVVLGFERMLSEVCEADGVWHYSQIEPEILEDIRRGRAALLFDLSNEGPEFDSEIFEELFAWIETNQLPPGRCIWLAQNRAIEASALAYGDKARLLGFEHYDYFIKKVAWHFSPLCDEGPFRDAADSAVERLFDADLKNRLLLCLNATPRLSRILTVAALHHYDLIRESIVSFPGVDYVKEGASHAEALGFIDRHPRLGYLKKSVDAVCEMPALQADVTEHKGNDLAFHIDIESYKRTFFSLVTETDFSDERIERATEKLAKAYAMGHPALVVGNMGAVRLMTDLGFQDWVDVFDRQSESESDLGRRLELVIDEVVVQSTELHLDRQEWMNAVRETGLYNVRHALSGRFLATLVRNQDVKIVNRLMSLVDID